MIIPATFYWPDFLITIGGAALIAALMVIFLPKMMYSFDPPLPELPKSFVGIAPVLAALVASVLYIIENDNQVLLGVWALVAAFAAVNTLTDFKFRRVPNVLNFNQAVLVTAGLVAAALMYGMWTNLMWAGIVLIAVGAWFFVALITGLHAAGDLKYLPVVAAALAFVNPWLAVVWLVFGYLLGFVFGVVQLATADKSIPKSQVKGAFVPPFVFALLALPFADAVGLVATL